MIEFSEKFTELAKAVLAVQGAVKQVVRDATNPHFKSRYATLENVVAAIRPHCVEHGLLVTQAPGIPNDGMVPVETIIVHAKSGEWMKSTISLPATKRDAQGVGSAITYACRYSLMAMFNLPPADDDGNAAVANGNGKVEETTAGGMTVMHPRTVSDGRQKSAYQAKKDGDHEIMKMLEECESHDSVCAFERANRDAIELMPVNWQNLANSRIDEMKEQFKSATHKQLEASVNILEAG